MRVWEYSEGKPAEAVTSRQPDNVCCGSSSAMACGGSAIGGTANRCGRGSARLVTAHSACLHIPTSHELPNAEPRPYLIRARTAQMVPIPLFVDVSLPLGNSRRNFERAGLPQRQSKDLGKGRGGDVGRTKGCTLFAADGCLCVNAALFVCNPSKTHGSGSSPGSQDDETAAIQLRPLDAVARHLLAHREAAGQALPKHAVQPHLLGTHYLA